MSMEDMLGEEGYGTPKPTPMRRPVTGHQRARERPGPLAEVAVSPTKMHRYQQPEDIRLENFKAQLDLAFNKFKL